MELHLISAGAAKGLVQRLAKPLREHAGAVIVGTFGAVGAMKERLVAGEPCDAAILTQALLTGLAEQGYVLGDSISPIGHVFTGVAVRARDTDVAVATPDDLRIALMSATSIFVPDTVKSTAGVHFMNVVDALGIREPIATALRPYPNGAEAMAALAHSDDERPVGCTQVTEILYTEGVRLVGKLPAEFALSTLYSVAIGANAHNPALAQRFIDLVGGPASAKLRADGGFE